MSYIIMGRDECNQEFRPRFPEFESEEDAYLKLDEARDTYQEARSLWVEELRDKEYYLKHRDYWEYDDYE